MKILCLALLLAVSGLAKDKPQPLPATDEQLQELHQLFSNVLPDHLESVSFRWKKELIRVSRLSPKELQNLAKKGDPTGADMRTIAFNRHEPLYHFDMRAKRMKVKGFQSTTVNLGSLPNLSSASTSVSFKVEAYSNFETTRFLIEVLTSAAKL